MHSFGNHFRSPEARRSAKRHTEVFAAEDDIAEGAALPKFQPILVEPRQDDVALKFIANIEPIHELALVPRLRRLKLGFSRSATPEAFL